MRNLYLIVAVLFVSPYMIVDANEQSIHDSYDICEKRCVYKKDIAGSVIFFQNNFYKIILVYIFNSYVQFKVCKYKEIVGSGEEVKACECGQFSVPSLVQQDEFSGYCVPILPSHEDCQSKCEAVDSEQETVTYLYSSNFITSDV